MSFVRKLAETWPVMKPRNINALNVYDYSFKSWEEGDEESLDMTLEVNSCPFYSLRLE